MREKDWDLMDTLRTIMLSISIVANVMFVQMFWTYREEYRIRSDNSIKETSIMRRDDSLTHALLITIIKGQINTHDLQREQILKVDSLTIKK